MKVKQKDQSLSVTPKRPVAVRSIVVDADDAAIKYCPCCGGNEFKLTAYEECGIDRLTIECVECELSMSGDAQEGVRALKKRFNRRIFDSKKDFDFYNEFREIADS